MSNLVPEKRVDKNGRLVTKHVRSGTKNKPVSLPAINVGQAVRRASTPLLDEHIVLGRATRERLGAQLIPFTLDDLAPEAVNQLERLLENDDAMRPRSYVIQSGINDAMGSDKLEECVARMHNIAVFGDIVSSSDNHSIVGYLSGLNQYPESIIQPGVDYLLESDDEQKDKVAALLEFTLAAKMSLDESLVRDTFMDTLDSDSGITELYFKLHDDELAAYVMAYPERGEQILQMIEEAGHPLSVQLLDDRFNHEVQSIRDGVL